MKRYVKSSDKTKSYQDYWAYKEVVKNWESDVSSKGNITDITIWYDKKKNDVYAKFQIKEFKDELGDGYQVYLIEDDGSKTNITDTFDFYHTLNDCIEGCFYYFHTRF